MEPNHTPSGLPPWQRLLSEQERENLNSSDPSLRLNATRFFRQLLSNENSLIPVIDHIIQLGITPKFIEFLQKNDDPQLQFEAAWVLTCMASGNSHHTQMIIQLGAVPLFIQLLSSPHHDVKEQAIWALGNIAGDGAQARDVVLNGGVMDPLLGFISSNPADSMLRNAVWTLANLCRGKPKPDFKMVSPAIVVLAYLLYSADEEVLVDALWALSYLSEGSSVDQMEQVVQAGVRRMIELLHHSRSVITPALRIIGNIVSGNTCQTQVVINYNALPSLCALISHSASSIRREACWTISNITAGTVQQIQAVIDANIIPKLIKNIEISNSHKGIRNESIWAILNVINGGNADQIMYILSHGTHCVEVFCDILFQDTKKAMKHDALRALLNIVRACRSVQDAPRCFEDVIEKKGLWHEVMYNKFRGTTGYEKRFLDNLRTLNTVHDVITFSFKNEMEDD
ncbi:hypothetical protein C9374_002798 [Naegleria lovaniensis]|uniref:Importin subunit alpha n=1 Tax=Naegleria lovaniensis TaxID=51637 RepID=A0AA88KQE1_NAELO|nr:uncharacterized protein C9374_002798 [Naegleria lovaniensis]KAG2386352.1 hypothetical protein C9374_002798 [Naegleria lovaniensis]